MRWWSFAVRRYAHRLLAAGVVAVVACVGWSLFSAIGFPSEHSEVGEDPWPHTQQDLNEGVVDLEDEMGINSTPEGGPPGVQVDKELLVTSALPSSLLEHLLPGEPPIRVIMSLNMSQPPAASMPCLHTRTEPSFPVCPHEPKVDQYISKQLLDQGTWEPQIISHFLTALHHYPSSTVVDLGAHVGVYSLLASAVGVRAVAVEPVWVSAVRLHAGAWAGGKADKVTILWHAMAHHRTHVKLKYKKGNFGGTSIEEISQQDAVRLQQTRPVDTVTSLTLNDLQPYVNTSNVLLKIDIEGWECQAVLGGTGFLSTHFAPYVFMEWSVLANHQHKYHAPCRHHHLQRMVQWFASRGYHAYITRSGVELNPARLHTWRAGDIYWRHRTAPRLHF